MLSFGGIHFSQSADVIIFLSGVGCYHFCYHLMLSFDVIIFHTEVFFFHSQQMLSFFLLFVGLLSFDVIIFHSPQMLSFLCYHFSLYLLGVIIYVISWCYPFLLSFPPFFLSPEGVSVSRWKIGGNDNKTGKHQMIT